MGNDLLTLGIWQLDRRALEGDLAAEAVAARLRELEDMATELNIQLRDARRHISELHAEARDTEQALYKIGDRNEVLR